MSGKKEQEVLGSKRSKRRMVRIFGCYAALVMIALVADIQIRIHMSKMPVVDEAACDTGLAEHYRKLTVCDKMGPNLGTALRRMADRTAAILLITANGPKSEGRIEDASSGFIYDDGIVVTVAHGVEDFGTNSSIAVVCDGKPVSVTDMQIEDTRDVAILVAPGCKGKKASFDDKPFIDKQPLYVTGFRFDGDSDRLVAKRYVDRTSTTTDESSPSYGNPLEWMARAAVERLHSQSWIANRLKQRVKTEERLRQMRHAQIPSLRAIRGGAIPGQSGSPVLSPDGRIVGMCDASNGLAETLIVPASSITEALRQAAVDGVLSPRP